MHEQFDAVLESTLEHLDNQFYRIPESLVHIA